jgi:hypothetical protein
MGIRDVLQGKRCDMCGHRGSDVIHYRREAMNLHAKCKKKLQAADRSAPPGAREAGYKPGQPPKLAGPMGGRYRGPEPQPQRRK